MQWTDLNFVTKTWTKPRDTTKSDRSHVMPLPPALLERLQRLPRLSPWVFDSPHNATGHWPPTTANLHWSRIRKRGHLPEVTIHDLRRTCASYLGEAGVNASVIARTLNHSSLQHVHIYTRLNTESIRSSLDTQAEKIMGCVTGTGLDPVRPSAPITPLIAEAPTPIEREEWPG